MGIMQQYNLSHFLHVGKTQSVRRKLILERMEADQSFSVSCVDLHLLSEIGGSEQGVA